MHPTTSRTAVRFLALSCIMAPLWAPASRAQSTNPMPPLRPPSVPLVTHDPYFSVWSASDKLYSSPTRHWTGRENRLSALIRVDGEPFRLMGNEPEEAASLPQKSVQVLPTRTIYTFANEKVEVQLTFLSPAIPSDLEVLSRPVTYISAAVRALDGKNHSIQFYADAGADLTVHDADSQEVNWSRASRGNITALRLGSVEQPVLGRRGDFTRIDWGHLYLAAPASRGLSSVLSSREAAQSTWSRTGTLPARDDTAQPRAAADRAPVAALAFNVGSVGAQAASRTWMVAYDDEYSINWMGSRLRPYWRRNGMDALGLLDVAARDYASLSRRSVAFDNELMADLRSVGGEKYARLSALAHRQALAAQKVVSDANGAPLSFSKENNSGGFIATVDVMYPASPQMMLLSPTLLKATLEPIMLYSAGPKWPFPFPPHDLGVYPRATDAVYGGGPSIPADGDVSSKMPVEESGNMLLLLGALSKIEGNTTYADRYWPHITKWANFLISKGYDLDNQLSTDDFSGHLAHNVNLSGKSIQALGAYAFMSEMRGDKAEATRVRGVAEGMVQQWMEAAKDGSHYRIAFDRPSTWSQKYNLVWDSILDINLFPDSVAEAEVAFYKTKQNRYGLPLDSRDNYTKLDWIIWSGTLTGRRADLDAFVDPIYTWMNETTSRVPLTDFYRTTNGQQVNFAARSVVGGVFIPVLNNREMWRKWAARDLAAARNVNLNWAPLPPMKQATEVVPTAAKSNAAWSFVFSQPEGNWFAENYDTRTWQTGRGGLGTDGPPGAVVGTRWNTPEIWARREFTLTEAQLANRELLQLWMYHDESADVYINGVLAARTSGHNSSYEPFEMTKAGLAALKPGRNVFAVHVRQTDGGQYIDIGLASVK